MLMYDFNSAKFDVIYLSDHGLKNTLVPTKNVDVS